MSKKNDNRKSVVVVGGGGAGSEIARTLSGKLDPAQHSLTLISERPFAIFLPASLRVVTTPDDTLEQNVQLTFDKLFINNNGTVVVGKVVAIENDKDAKSGDVVLDDGEKVHYDVLVLAPGSHWSGALAFPAGGKAEFHEHVVQWRKTFENAKGVVLAGGGSVGIELAGELRDLYPNKKITLVHSDAKLLNAAYPDKFRTKAEQGMRTRNIDIVFGDYVDDFDAKGSITTRKGQKLEGDLVVPTYGARPASEFVASLGSDTLTDRGHAKVRSTLQLRAFDNIFAAGDILDWKEQKQLAKCRGHAAVIVANVLSILGGAAPAKEYKGSIEMILVTNGKNGGVGYLDILWGITLGNFIARLLKSKTLLIGEIQSAYGLA
ncbi:hypothetical protein EWM64_g6094 [Hericium alpestre]|uniref:FAD/NAD(P)-binding domain-containing protein n=1 Tax=Hericium alpestre TaxID=135208 RepID=A0A4Y9ZSQ3_9AGAM|nr:hypothetical protein EWM64_g6094 [Hericium alpestre]